MSAPDAQISVIGGLDTTGGNGAAGIGFSAFTASTPVVGAAATNSATRDGRHDCCQDDDPRRFRLDR